MSSRKGKQAKRIRRVSNDRARFHADVPRSSLFDQLPRPDAGEQNKKRRREGSYFTPMPLVEEVVAKALYPHILWMSEDPEGWDRAHQRPAFVKAAGPLMAGAACPPAPGAADRREREEIEEIRKDHGPLMIALSAAVPLWIEKLRSLTAQQRIDTAHSLAETVACKGDVLMYGSKKKGEAADVFNAVARGLAALSYQPGGVTFVGMHFEATDAP